MNFKSISKNTICLFSEFINPKYIFEKSEIKSFFPFWHTVSDIEPIHIKHLYKIKSIKNFKDDIDFLTKYFQPVSFEDFIKNNNSNNKPKIVLSFDDGLSECYNIIAPILVEKGIPAIFFINSDFVDNKKMFYKHKLSIIKEKIGKRENEFISKKIIPENYFNLKHSEDDLINKLAEILDIDFYEYMQTQKPYMNMEQIHILEKQGFEIGAHSLNHPLYSEISILQQILQTERSLFFIKLYLNQKLKLFAFPFTDFGVSDLFFETVYSTNTADYTFGTAGIKKDYFEKNIQRIAMENEGKSAKKIIKSEFISYKIKSFFNLEKVKR